MALYEKYLLKCKDCGHRETVSELSIYEPSAKSCPHCGKQLIIIPISSQEGVSAVS
ncbi:MAG: hypothetical protein BWY51_00661 [Parcubacteria group bacterium ADurb.Bin316]|nr:MAG: hypothetical protein BWY51_00661 [Parcubacteria group bacterium ADurb.Bin316]HOZ56194.1 hypothetical protein [bacterium]